MAVQRYSFLLSCLILQYFALASHCLRALLKDSQNCQVRDLLYVTVSTVIDLTITPPSFKFTNTRFQQTQGRSVRAGLGAEFNHYLIHSLLNALWTKRRLVFLTSMRSWEYDCPERLGWACYLSLPCKDSVVNMSSIDFSYRNALHDKDDAARSFETLKMKFNPRSFCGANNDIATTSPTELTAIVAKFLYSLNNSTMLFTQKYNEQYGFGSSKYLSVQIRLGDKVKEMPRANWEWMTNTSNIVEVLRPYLATNKRIFVATDNCSTVFTMATMLPPDVQLRSPCLLQSAANTSSTTVSEATITSLRRATIGIDYIRRAGGEIIHFTLFCAKCFMRSCNRL